jgi:hypothetical protein
MFGGREIERRPRGASRATLAPTFVSGQLFLGQTRATAFGAWRDIASNKQGGRARLSQALLAKNKRRSERCSRCAARAALDLTGATLSSPAPSGPDATPTTTRSKR